MGSEGGRGAGSLLATLLSSGRLSVSRSFRLHRPRGGFCARGYCQQCPVALDETRGLACELPGELRLPRAPADVDPLRPLGMFAERMPPWFYEERMRSPRALRQPFLRIVRRLSAAASLPRRVPIAAGSLGEIRCDVLVVGGGTAGIVSAIEAAAAGREVVLVTRGPLGGRSPLPPRAAERRAEDVGRLHRAGVLVLEHAECLGLHGPASASVVTLDGPRTIEFQGLVVATGAYDRLLPVAGNDLPGVIGMRALERLAADGATFGGVRIGVFAAPDEAERVAAADRGRALPIAWLAGPAGLPESDAPSFPASRLVRIEGRRRVTGAVLEGHPPLPCDLLVLGFSQPTYELQVQAGMGPRVEGSPAAIRPAGPSRFPTVEVGEAAGHVRPEEAIAGAREAMRLWLAGLEAPTAPSPDLGRVAAEDPNAFLCLCEDVRVRDLDRAVAEGFADVELFKRRSGTATGACQGKLCLCLLQDALAERGLPSGLPTIRPPIRPVAIADLGAADG